jgi:glutathione synthase/RimK-type ligase-like ATP-grasp enzyme
MLVGIHKGHAGFPPFLEKYEKILDHNAIDHIRMDSDASDFWDLVRQLDLFIYRIGHVDFYKDRGAAILPVVENHYGIPTLPNYNTSWHYDDKIKQYYMLQAHGFPLTESWIFWDKKHAVEFASKAKYPLVFKLKGGAGSSSVILVKNESQALRLIHRMFGRGMLTGGIPSWSTIRFSQFSLKKEIKRLVKPMYQRYKGEDPRLFWLLHKNYVYFQKFYPGNEWDTRVTTIGDRVYGFRRFVRKNDFRASGSDNWSLDRDKIDKDLLGIGLEISRKLGLQVMAYDFIYDEQKKPRLIEISYTYGDYPEFHNGFWDRDLNWISGEFNTQYLELVDALKKPDLKYLSLPPIGHYAKVKF